MHLKFIFHIEFWLLSTLSSSIHNFSLMSILNLSLIRIRLNIFQLPERILFNLILFLNPEGSLLFHTFLRLKNPMQKLELQRKLSRCRKSPGSLGLDYLTRQRLREGIQQRNDSLLKNSVASQ
jgi:hypothetical protein